VLEAKLANIAAQLTDEPKYLRFQRCIVAAKARDHRRKESFRIEAVEIKWVTGMCGDESQECCLRATITFSEGVNRIQSGEKHRSFPCKRLA